MSDNNQNDEQTRTHAVLVKGVNVGRYRIVEKIGAGGMGEVYLAHDTDLDRKVALKFLPIHMCADAECRSRFKREAQAAAKLDHPNIVTVHEVGEFQGRPYFAMAFIEGQSLKDYAVGKNLPIEKILEVGRQVCAGLQAAHDKGIIHRDLKPSNILIDTEGRIRIADFGLAAVAGSEPLTKTGSTLGTIGYMSPEQIRGEELDNRSDLFSFGVMLYEILTGVHPFRSDNEATTLNAVLNSAPRPIPQSGTAYPQALIKILDRLIEKNPGKRYRSAGEVVRDIDKIQSASSPGEYDQTINPSIAVLPFANLSADPEQEYFCDGMAEEIITALTQIPHLRVIARTSAFAFKGKNEDIREIGRKLDVNTLLEGSVRKAGKQIRITAQLINVSDGSHLWSERFDRELEDVFAIHDDIAQAIVSELKLKLVPQPGQSLIKKHTENLEAYSLVLKGRYYWNQLTAEGWTKGLDCFQKAIDIDPDYAMPYVWIAILYQSQSFWGEMSPREANAKSSEAIKEALRLDPMIADLYNLQAVWYFSYDRDWKAAEQAFKKSLDLAPMTAITHTNYALFLTIRQRFDEAIKHAETARNLDPLSSMISTWVALPHLVLGDCEKAAEILKSAIELEPTYWQPYLHLAVAYMEMSKLDEALAMLENSLAYSGGASIVMAILSICCYRVNDTARADEFLEKLKERSDRAYVSPMYFAWIYIGRGSIDQAIIWIEKAGQEHDPWLVFYSYPRAVLDYNDSRLANSFQSIGLPKPATNKNGK